MRGRLQGALHEDLGQCWSGQLLRADPVLELCWEGLRAHGGRECAIHRLLPQQQRPRDLSLGQRMSERRWRSHAAVIGSLHFDRMQCTARRCGTRSLWFNNTMSLLNDAKHIARHSTAHDAMGQNDPHGFVQLLILIVIVLVLIVLGANTYFPAHQNNNIDRTYSFTVTPTSGSAPDTVVFTSAARSNTTTPAGFTATPMSGASPLIVEFGYHGRSSAYRVYFGDGQSSDMHGEVPPGGTYSGYVMAAHNYTSIGTYTATLTECNTLGSALITVH